MPTDKVNVANEAEPDASVSAPSCVLPSMNVTVPVGVWEGLPVTVAVNVTEAPDWAGFKLEDTVVVVGVPAKFETNARASTEPKPVTWS